MPATQPAGETRNRATSEPLTYVNVSGFAVEAVSPDQLENAYVHVPFGALTQVVTFTVTVTPSGAATPSGAVQLYDNGQAYGSAANVSAGIATFFSTNLPVGVHNITADYRGDANTQPSTSTSIMQVITGTTALQISGNASGITETADVIVMVN